MDSLSKNSRSKTLPRHVTLLNMKHHCFTISRATFIDTAGDKCFILSPPTNFLRKAMRPRNFFGSLQLSSQSSLSSTSNISSLKNFYDDDNVELNYSKQEIFHNSWSLTCNPQCRETSEALLPGQKPTDQPDIVVKVLKAKLWPCTHVWPYKWTLQPCTLLCTRLSSRNAVSLMLTFCSPCMQTTSQPPPQ